MRFFASFVLIASLLAPALASPTKLKDVEVAKGGSTGKYIVKFKPGTSRKQWSKKLKPYTGFVEWDAFESFSTSLDTATLNTLRASDDVEYITEDGYMHAIDVETETNAPWGLQRISQVGKLARNVITAVDYTYTYDSSAGTGVDIYVVDTGVYTAHSEFGGRARFGFKALASWSNNDGHGHGTHVAGTAAGSRYGVAKNATIIAVKVLSDSGSGSNTGVISGLEWVLEQVKNSGRPSVVSMSLGGSGSTAVDNAVQALITAGVHAVVAAGNDAADAKNYSPARVKDAITVGATDINDSIAYYSNFGSLVDIFAPGTGITSSWNTDISATNRISGTSMATPHVSGLVAYLISKDGNDTPASLTTKLTSLAIKGAISGVPSSTVNLLAQNGI